MCMLFAKGTTLNRKVLRKGIDKTAVDRAVARHYTLSGQILLLLSKVGAAMTHKEVKLNKGVLIEEQCNALARGQLSFAVLLFDTLWSAPKHELLFFLEHQVNFFLDCGHHIPPDDFYSRNSCGELPKSQAFLRGTMGCVVVAKDAEIKRSAILMLTDLKENALRRLRMEECNLCTACPNARLLIDHADALCHEIGNRILDVVNAQGNVLDALAVLLNVFRNRAVRSRADEQLDLAAVRGRMERRRDLLLCNGLLIRAGDSDHICPEILPLFEILYSNADVIHS